MNTQKPSNSAKNAPYCIRIWNHTQKNYELKSRQALPDGVFGHFKARKSYPFILLQNRRLEICSKTHSKAVDFHFKNHYFSFRLLYCLSIKNAKVNIKKSYLQCRSVQGNIPQPFRATILFSYFSGTI